MAVGDRGPRIPWSGRRFPVRPMRKGCEMSSDGAAYSRIFRKIWHDRKFRSLTDDAQIVFLLLLTHPDMTACGGLVTTLGRLIEDKGNDWTPARMKSAIDRLGKDGMVDFDAKDRLLALPQWLAYNGPNGPNAVRGLLSAIVSLPECPLRSTIAGRCLEHLAGKTDEFRKAVAKSWMDSIRRVANEFGERE